MVWQANRIGERLKMKVLVINGSPVKNGATAEIVRIVTDCLEKRHNVKTYDLTIMI